jgi:hypothetical protein
VRRGWVPALVVAALVLVALLPGLLADAFTEASNARVIRGERAILIKAGATRCQNGEFLPSGAHRLAFVLRPTGAPQGNFQATLRYGGRLVAAAEGGGAFPRDKMVSIPMRWHERPSSLYPVRLCLRNPGPGPIAFEGNLSSTNPEAPSANNGPFERRTDEVRINYEGQPTSRLGAAGDVADRWSLFRPGFVRPWQLWVILAIFLGAGVLAVRSVIRMPEAR